MAEIAQSTCNNNSSRPVAERKERPQKDQVLNCPRCHSTNTKFCYYNNYSLTQPRYFCKTCRRYWTEGGTLRNVPVGGGSRKNKRSSTATTATIPTVLAAAVPAQKFPELSPPGLSEFASHNPKSQQRHDLNLGFPGLQGFHGVPQFLELGKVENGQRDHHHHHHQLINSNSSSIPSSTSFSTLELLKTGIASRELSNSLISTTPVSDLNALYRSGYPLFHEMKPPTLHFPHVEGVNGGISYDHRAGPNGVVVQENVGKVMFPLGGILKQNSSPNEAVEDGDNDDGDDQSNKGQGNSTGYWNGMLGEGSW